MYSQSDLNDAVTGGALSQEQADSLRSFIATRNGAPTADEEHFRLLTGFNDFLCFFACLFILIAAGWLGTLIPMGGSLSRVLPVSAPFAPLFIAAASWGLAEIFTRRRHQWLTSILLIVGATWGVALFLLLLFLSGGMTGPDSATIIGALSMLAGGGAAFLHWKRHRLPIAIATMYGFGLLAVLCLIANSLRGSDALMIVLLLAGIGAFLYGMWWDSRDPMRHGDKSEAGFWLHWLAAGLTVNALATLFGVNQGVGSVGGAIGVIAIFLVLALIGLTVNRRAYALTAISPLVVALQSLLGEGSRRSYDMNDRFGSSPYGSSYSPYGSPYGSPYSSYRSEVSVEATMLTFLIVGVILLLLAIYWAPVRRVLVGVLPENLRAKLPPTDTTARAQAETFE
ncbi:MAG TPA: hypothetical protein VEC11_05715 [Allosphingosinicella sp.]|nr:hypothetical protein [Allosphingosinicella sp.]